jgi:two-component sensor histidine kinase
MPFSTSWTRASAPQDGALLLIEEISHRVINEYTRAISTICVAAKTIDHVPARRAMLGAVQSLHSQADAHRALQVPLSGGRIDIGDYLQTVCAALSNAYLADAGIRLTLSRCPAPLPADVCWRLGLVVTELVNNAARHGLGWAEGRIRVELEVTQSELYCSVSDNGRSSARPAMGRGGHIVTALVADLGGLVDWSFHDLGVNVIVLIPLPASEPKQSPP